MALYDAFVSYSHTKDKPIAAALQSVVQKLGKPWYRRRALRVFRDDTSLSATPSLWPSIEQALNQSRYFILLASPEAAASKWVNKEVAHWLDHHGVGTLLIGVTDGDLAWDESIADFTWRGDTPLPPVLTGRFASEPKWVDLTAYRDGADRRDAKFTELAADFAAAIRGMPKEDLLSQEVSQQRRALTLAWSAAASLLVLAGLAGWQWKVAIDNERAATEQKQIAQQQRDRAEKTLSAASQTANDLVFKLAAEFRDRSGMPIDLVRRILDQAQGLQKQLADVGETSPQLRYAEGAALNELAIAYQYAGDLPAALDAARRSVAIAEKMSTEDPAAVWLRRDTGICYQTLGNVLRAMGRREEALEAYGKSLAIYEQVLAEKPGDIAAQGNLATAHYLIGETVELTGAREQAHEHYQKSLAISEPRAAAEPDNLEWQRKLSLGHAKIGDALDTQGKRAEALEAHRKALAVRERIAAADPGRMRAQHDLGLNRSAHRDDSRSARKARGCARGLSQVDGNPGADDGDRPRQCQVANGPGTQLSQYR